MKPVTPAEAINEVSCVVEKINLILTGLGLKDFPKMISLEEIGLDPKSPNKEIILSCSIAAYKKAGWDVSKNRSMLMEGLYFSSPITTTQTL
ncbi:MAG: hypothetical protein WCO18_01090 [bacterium]